MTHVCQDDGLTYLDGGEQWRVSGYVTVKVWVDFTTTSEPGDMGFDDDLNDAVSDFDDWEVEDIDGLDFEAEAIE